MNIARISSLLVASVMTLGTGCVVEEDAGEVAQADMASDADQADMDTENVEEAASAIGISGTRSTLPERGGNGGTAFTFNCPAGSLLVGFDGRSGREIDRLQPICARLAANGSLGSAIPSGSVFGGNGGAAFPSVKLCPAGEAVVGFRGRSGGRLDRLELRCTNAVLWRDRGTLGSVVLVGGGTGGAAFDDICPRSFLLVGFNGRSGSRIDKIQGICARVA